MSSLNQKTLAGYKQTDIGIIPNDWMTSNLGDICILINGRGFKPYEWSREGLPIIRIQNLNGSDEFNYYEGHYNPKILIKHGQLLFAWSGSRGTSFGPHIWYGEDALLNYHTWKIDIKSGIEPSYFYHALKNLTKIIENSAHGASALVHTQMGEMKKFVVPIPDSKQEQTAIANALSDVDGLIQELEKLIAKKQAIKTATMQQLLTGRTRLPQFAHHPDGRKKGYKPSELGEIPEDWEVVPFSQHVWFQEGPGVRQFQFTSLGVKLLNGTNIENGSLFLEKTQRHISEKLAYGQYAHFMIDEGDILIACSGVTIERFDEKVTIATKEDLPLCLNTSTMRFKARTENVDFNYIKNFLKSEFFKNQIGGKATGSAQLNFGPYHVNQVIIALPEKSEQIAISLILSNMDEEIRYAEQRLNKTRQIKQGMMQELLTGKTRLVKPAEPA